MATRAFAHLPSPAILQRPFLGYSLFLDVSRSNAQRLLFLEGERFITERELLANLVTPSATVVDVGANIGYYTLLFSKLAGANGRIIALEPEPDNLVELRLNVERNGLSHATVHPFAVGARAGTVAFARGINGGVQGSEASGTVEAVDVPMVALDEILTDRVDVMKIDVEGYEGEVLQGAAQSIARWTPNLFLEIHPKLLIAPHTVGGIFEFLQRHYTDITLYQPAQGQSMSAKLMSRYFGVGTIEALPPLHTVAARCERGEQETFWAICRS